MDTLQELYQKIKQTEEKVETFDKKKEEYATLSEDSKAYLELLRQMEPLYKKGAQEPLENINYSLQAIRKRPGKPNVQIYEEIMSLHGKPMHMTDILDSALRMGVTFKQGGEPRNQLRNALNGAKKRFKNIGNNTWWIADRPIPDQENREGAL